uniref:Bifunctional inhibitor/plant lipid transfer protein/seed storage helical domain-containing protein n=1 Tax=Kalanchoe fedtschenkoi TaxID=63787 RepID=A0A7N0ZWY4_KALFE
MAMKGAAQKLSLLVLSLALLAAHTANAQICNMKTEGLMSCKPAVTAPNPLPPTDACCAALAHGDMDCLCGFKHSRMLSALGIDSDLAMQLPDKCGVKHAPCN